MLYSEKIMILMLDAIELHYNAVYTMDVMQQMHANYNAIYTICMEWTFTKWIRPAAKPCLA